MPEYVGYSSRMAPYTGDLERDAAVTVVEFMLSPDVPPTERKFFRRFYIMFSKTMALGNIKREDIFPIIMAFDEICILLEMGLYDEARKLMAKELMKMQLSRSVGGFWTLYGQQGVQRTEQVERIFARSQKKGLASRISRAIGGRKGKEQVEPYGYGLEG
jgi:hypothetical protein